MWFLQPFTFLFTFFLILEFDKKCCVVCFKRQLKAVKVKAFEILI